MAIKRSEVLYEQLYDEDDRLMKCNVGDSYQERRAFFNRMKKKRPEDMNRSEIQKLMKSVEIGLDKEFLIPKAINTVKVEMRASEENGTYFDGIKNWCMYKKILGILEGLK